MFWDRELVEGFNILDKVVGFKDERRFQTRVKIPLKITLSTVFMGHKYFVLKNDAFL